MKMTMTFIPFGAVTDIPLGPEAPFDPLTPAKTFMPTF